MKKTKIIYWIFTALLMVLMAPGAVMDIINGKDVVEIMHDHLGYPNYVAPFLGVAKLLGCIALLIPGFPKVKEWVYAGFIFDLAGATYSSIAVGDPVKNWAPLLPGFVIITGSYIYHHKIRKGAES
jgi:uncharacterized membrane protein YphA (DoxX/SURF4 family)